MTPDYWAGAWEEAARNSPTGRRRRGEEEAIAHWNRRAESFVRSTAGADAVRKREEVLALLRQEGALRPGVRVLDIGAGPGNFALPLARVAAEVVAVEPAAAMLRILRERAAREGISNITCVQATWQEIDLDARGWRGSFDLVFASMSPGVQNAAMLEKMMAASRDFCYYSSFAGPRWDVARVELWRRFFGEDLNSGRSEIVFPFMYLYTSGYRPLLHFGNEYVRAAKPVAAVVDELALFFEQYTDVTPAVRDTIAAYVQARAQGGIYRWERRICSGMMLWRVRQEAALP